VYLPPAWFAADRPPLPVVMLLPGTPGTPVDWTRSGHADVTADRYAAAHGGRAPILVMPDATGHPLRDTECVDGPSGQAEQYLVVDVAAEVVRRFDAAADGENWAVAGSSAGGTCAVMLALRHPDRFAAFVDLSGDVRPNVGSRPATLTHLFGGSADRFRAHDPAWLLTARRFGGTSGWFEVGTRDRGPLAATEELAPMARLAGIRTCSIERRGGHDFAFWSSSFDHALPWLSAVLGLDPAPRATACAAAGGH
jgi:S-formylglutathione hydrolase FrmB